MYLPQNAFSDSDASTPIERQKVMFDVLEKALFSDYTFSEKEEMRKFFMDLQQTFIDWNDKAMGTPEFTALKDSLLTKIDTSAVK